MAGQHIRTGRRFRAMAAAVIAVAGLAASPVVAAASPAAADDVSFTVSILGRARVGGTLWPSVSGLVGDNEMAVTWAWSCGGVVIQNSYVFSPNARCLGSSVDLTATVSWPDGRALVAEASPTAPITDVVVTLDQVDMTAVITNGLIESGTRPAVAGDVIWTTQWFRDGVPILTEAGGSTHAFVPADIGHRLSVSVTAHQASTGLRVSHTSLATPPVGQVKVEATLTTPQSARPGDDVVLQARVAGLYPGLSGWPKVQVRWFRDGTAVPEETDSQSHRIASLDLGHTMRAVLVTDPAQSSFGYYADPREVSTVLPGRAYSTTVISNQYSDRTRDLFLRRPDGSFHLVAVDYPGTPPRLYDFHVFGGGWQSMTALSSGGDLSGDSRADLVARRKDGTLLLYRSTGDGTLEAPTVLGTGWNGMSAILAAGDLDRDGHGDLLARRASDGALLLYVGTGAGRIRPGKVIGTGFGKALQIVANEDYTGDSRADVYATWPDGTLRLYKANWGGDLSRGVIVGTGWSGMARLVDGGDANADGRSDVYALDRSGALWVYPGDGAGRFLPRFRLKSELPYSLSAGLY
jgi:hypothetical protein